MTQRLLNGVVGTIALTILLTVSAHAGTSGIAECFTDEGRGGGGKRICVSAPAQPIKRSVHSAAKSKVAVPAPAKEPLHNPATTVAAITDNDLVRKARAYIGMTAGQVGVRRDLWCSAFMRKIAGTPRGVDDRAISWNSQPHVPAQVGVIIIVRSRRIHVGVVSGFDKGGNPIVVSGNHSNRVAETVYAKARVIAYVAPGA